MIEKERARLIYQTMNRIRCFELKAVSLFEANKLRGSVHLYVGEEAVAATVCSRLTDQDYIASTHRGHGHCIAKGEMCIRDRRICISFPLRNIFPDLIGIMP